MRIEESVLSSPARIAIVDDHDMLSIGVAAFLNSVQGIRVVSRVRTVDAMLKQGTQVDLVLLDLRLADGSTPTDNIGRLRRAGIEVLAYTSAENSALLREAARADVIGVVRKSAPPNALIDAVQRALRGEVIASADWAAAIDADHDVTSAGLTRRESEVLELYASGEKADRVARTLGISRETVLYHIQNIRGKYAGVSRPAHTKVDLYRRAVEDGILQGPL